MSVQKWISNEVRYLTDSYIVNLFLVAGLANGRNDGQSSSMMINAYPLRLFGVRASTEVLRRKDRGQSPSNQSG